MVGISKLQNTRATTSSGDRFNPILSQVSPRVRHLWLGVVVLVSFASPQNLAGSGERSRIQSRKEHQGQ